METAEHREPYESRGSRTDLAAPGGESPPGDSTASSIPDVGAISGQRAISEIGRYHRHPVSAPSCEAASCNGDADARERAVTQTSTHSSPSPPTSPRSATPP